MLMSPTAAFSRVMEENNLTEETLPQWIKKNRGYLSYEQTIAAEMILKDEGADEKVYA